MGVAEADGAGLVVFGRVDGEAGGCCGGLGHGVRAGAMRTASQRGAFGTH
ncbi:hypothetical protein TPA0909_03160 [Streptomyces albus]|nr:hypothetical protein TPA0909_03160 [Streptomyces albus]